MTPLTKYTIEDGESLAVGTDYFLAADVEAVLKDWFEHLIKAMEDGHYKQFSFTLKESYCPQCNIAWPCGEIVRVRGLLDRLKGTP